MIDFIIGLFTGGGSLYGILAAIGGVLAAVGAFYFKVVGGVKRKAKLKDFERSKDIEEQADAAREKSSTDTRTSDERLRERGKLRD